MYIYVDVGVHWSVYVKLGLSARAHVCACVHVCVHAICLAEDYFATTS